MVLKRLLLILSAICVCESASVAQSPTEFADWKMNTERMPRLNEIEPNAPYGLAFRLGHVIFAYEPYDWKRRGLEQKPTKLESMVRVGKAVTVSEPSAAFQELVNQQLQQKQTFQFKKARLSEWGESGYRWEVIWKRFPVYGGLVEEPEQIKILVTAEGTLVPHDRYLIDTVQLLLPKPEFNPEQNPRYRKTERPRIWPCSKLKLTAVDATPERRLNASAIEVRARKALEEMIKTLHEKQKAESFQFRFINVQTARLPMRLSTKGNVEYIDVWAVNFQEVQNQESKVPLELFTVWVKQDGTVADLRLIDERDRN